MLGEVYRGKVLGCFCLIDQGEVDWKVLTVDVEEAKREKISSLDDYPPEQVWAVREWFTTIKVSDGKEANTIAYDEKIFSRDETLAIIDDTHK